MENIELEIAPDRRVEFSRALSPLLELAAGSMGFGWTR